MYNGTEQKHNKKLFLIHVAIHSIIPYFHSVFTTEVILITIL